MKTNTESEPIIQWGETYREMLSKGQEAIRFEINMQSDVYRALLIESTASGQSLFGICNTMLRLGIDRFIAEELEWSEITAPCNIVPFPSFFEYSPAIA